MNYHNSEKNHELPLKLRIWSLKVRIWSCKSKFGLLVAPNSKVLRSPNAVINFKFGQLVGFDPLTNLANNEPLSHGPKLIEQPAVVVAHVRQTCRLLVVLLSRATCRICKGGLMPPMKVVYQ